MARTRPWGTPWHVVCPQASVFLRVLVQPRAPPSAWADACFFCSSDFGRGLSGPPGAAPLSRVSMRPRGFPVGQEPRGICLGQPDGGWKQLVISHKTMLVPCPAGWRWKIKKTKQNKMVFSACTVRPRFVPGCSDCFVGCALQLGGRGGANQTTVARGLVALKGAPGTFAFVVRPAGREALLGLELAEVARRGAEHPP